MWDPNQSLAAIRRIVAYLDSDASCADTPLIRLFDLDELLDHWQALDSWLTAGGCLPRGWSEYTDPRTGIRSDRP